MTQDKNKTPRSQEAKAPDKTPTQAPTLGTLLATALGIAPPRVKSPESRLLGNQPNRNTHNQH